MKRLKPVPSIFAPSLLAVALVAISTVPFAMGQTLAPSPQVKPEAPALPQRASSPETTSSRSRRAAPASPDQKPAENPTAATPVSETSSVPISKIAVLRDEMNSATNEQERARLQLKLVDHFVAAGLKREAMAALKAMSEEERFDPQGFYNIGNAQARLGESEGAIESYRKAIAQRKGRYSRAANNLGVMLMRTGRWDEAYEALISALQQENFRYAEASFNLGRLYTARGENDLAIREWRRAIAVDPEHEAAARALRNTKDAGIAVAGGVRRSSPEPTSRRTAEPPPRARSSSNAADSKPPRVGSKPSGVASRRLSYTIDTEAYALLQRGRSARERGRNEEAADHYRQVLARTGGYFPPANLELSYVLMALKRVDDAIAALLPVTINDGNEIPLSHYHLARLYEARGDLKLAENHYSLAAEAFGENNAQFFLDIGRVREKQGNLSGALMSLEQYIASMERHGRKPEWSDERLTDLRQKLAASQPKP